MNTLRKIALTGLCIAAAAGCGNKKKTYVIEMDPAYNIGTETLLKKCPITFQTPAESAEEKGIQNRMLNGFNCWNKGYDAWAQWTDAFFTKDIAYGYNDDNFDLAGLRANAKALLQVKDIRRVKVYNILTGGNWAAIHSWHVVTAKDGSRDVFDSMAFYHFTEADGDLRVDQCWIKENS